VCARMIPAILVFAVTSVWLRIDEIRKILATVILGVKKITSRGAAVKMRIRNI